MRPLDEEDALETIEVHVTVDEAVFGRLPVLGEDLLPGLVTNRWNDSGYDVPLDDGKTGARQSHETTDDHHQEDQACNQQQPAGDRISLPGTGPLRLCSRFPRSHRLERTGPGPSQSTRLVGSELVRKRSLELR